MTMQELLHSNPLLSGLRAEDIEVVTSWTCVRAFAPGEMLFLAGHVADAALLVRRGRVAIDVHRPAVAARRVETVETVETIETLGVGAVIGWNWIVAPYRWTFDARALDDVEVIAIEGTGLRTKALADAAFGVAILSRVAALVLHQLEDQRRRLPIIQGARCDDH